MASASACMCVLRTESSTVKTARSTLKSLTAGAYKRMTDGMVSVTRMSEKPVYRNASTHKTLSVRSRRDGELATKALTYTRVGEHRSLKVGRVGTVVRHVGDGVQRAWREFVRAHAWATRLHHSRKGNEERKSRTAVENRERRAGITNLYRVGSGFERQHLVVGVVREHGSVVRAHHRHAHVRRNVVLMHDYASEQR